MSIRIDHLEVQFDVEGSSDEAVFARLFERFAAEREQQLRARERADRIAERNRRLHAGRWEDD